jgi:hypothetical protein
MNLTNEQKEDLRTEALAALVVRHPAALTPRQLAKPVKKELDFLFEESDLVAALEILRGLKFAEWIVNELGGSKYWRATSEGVLKVERS